MILGLLRILQYFSLIILSIGQELRRPPGTLSGLPHCSAVNILLGDITYQNPTAVNVKVDTSLQLRLRLNQTACFFVDLANSTVTEANGNKRNVSENHSKDSVLVSRKLLYTLTYKNLRNDYPVRQQYTFGIPRLQSDCICDCSGGEDHCPIGNEFQDCANTGDQVCYNTYHPHQRSTGCQTGMESEVCCKITVSPYKDWEMTAVELGSGTTVGVYEYALYGFAFSKWSKISEQQLNVYLNGQDQKYTLGKDSEISLAVRGNIPRINTLSDVYFTLPDSNRLRTGVPINQLYEFSLEKLGWFRKVESESGSKKVWQIRRAGIKLKDMHYVSVENCKDQLYTDSYNAEFLVSVGKTGPNRKEVELLNYFLGNTLESTENWMKSAYLADRQAVVEFRYATPNYIDIQFSSQYLLHFMHHSSSLGDFNGAIYLDKFSNRFLNVTFIEAKGTLVGAVYVDSDISKPSDLAFSVHVLGETGSDVQYNIIHAPSTVNSSRYVCLHPSQREQDIKCKWLRYESVPLDWFEIPEGWSSSQGHCPGCNQMTFNNFLKYLNPGEWLNGIKGPSEIVSFIFEVVIYIVVILIAIVICKKCVIPLAFCALCNCNPSVKELRRSIPIPLKKLKRISVQASLES